ncbi:NAD(P)-binding protein [Wallemia mellicola]|nr:NAD(P)-binding protein [Wallemia mellicola]
MDLAKFVRKQEDHLDLLVNNAGVTTVNAQLDAEDNSAEAISKRMLEQNFDDWLQLYAVNTASIYFTSVTSDIASQVSAAFLPLLMATRKYRCVSGNIVNVTSMSGIMRTSQDGQFSYNANKAAARSLSTQLANDFTRPHINVRVNQLALGYFPSQMTKITTSGEEKEYFINKWHIPFGRAGTSEDIFKLLLKLATNEYMTDSTQVVDGGYLCVVP